MYLLDVAPWPVNAIHDYEVQNHGHSLYLFEFCLSDYYVDFSVKVSYSTDFFVDLDGQGFNPILHASNYFAHHFDSFLSF